MNVHVRYVDGSVAGGDAESWPNLRSDGVDFIEVDGIRIAAQSIYWLRRVSDGWRAGGASFYDQDPFEVEISDDGVQREIAVARDEVPDLLHHQVKLGGWWPE